LSKVASRKESEPLLLVLATASPFSSLFLSSFSCSSSAFPLAAISADSAELDTDSVTKSESADAADADVCAESEATPNPMPLPMPHPALPPPSAHYRHHHRSRRHCKAAQVARIKTAS